MRHRPLGFGVTWKFTLDNYKNILEPVYLNTFVESLKLALTSTVVIALIGYPFGYFMARLPEHRKKKAQLLLSTPFWVNSLDPVCTDGSSSCRKKDC